MVLALEDIGKQGGLPTPQKPREEGDWQSSVFILLVIDGDGHDRLLSSGSDAEMR
jgi:hypothetical protein